MFDVVSFVTSQEALFSGALVDSSVKWQRECQFAIQAFQKSEFLAKTAASNPSSAQNAIINVAAIGVSLNPAEKLAYLVPRDGMVCLDISYMGLLQLAQSTGAIKWGQCKLVYSNDTYESNGLDRAPTHRYNAFSDRGEIVGGYCTVKTADGDYLTEEMNTSEINEIMLRSSAYKAYQTKGKKCPWVTDWGEMARKTIVKRASKYWPKHDRLSAAIDYLNTDGGEGFHDAPEQPEIIVNPVDVIKQAIKSKGRTEEQFFEWFSKARRLDNPIQSFSVMTDDELQWAARKMEAAK